MNKVYSSKLATLSDQRFSFKVYIEPQDVLNAIDKALANNELFVFPGKNTKMILRTGKWFPNVIWKNLHKVEGR